MSKTEIDNAIWNIRKYLMDKNGVDAANRLISPLTYYINTGRAPTEFIKRLCATKPFIIGRILSNGGSDREIITKIKKRIGFNYDDFGGKI